jgi:hypothetical protein
MFPPVWSSSCVFKIINYETAVLPYHCFGRYYTAPFTRMCIRNMCKYLLLELCILCVIVCLWLIVVYLLEMAGCSACHVMLRDPLANVSELDSFYLL